MEHKAIRRSSIIAAHLLSKYSNESTCLTPINTNGSCCSENSGILCGQTAIITGSGQGIGEAAARLFAKQGANVVVTDLDKSKSDAVVADINANGGHAISVPGDVCDPQFPEHLMKEAISAFGDLTILINNAGYTWDGMVHNMSDKQWEAMLMVHNTAPFRLIRAAAPFMREAAKKEITELGQAKSRSIINVSSTSGLHGNIGQANYACAKAGVLGLTKTICKEWGMFNIRCNAIAFGWINTRLTAEKVKDNFIEVDGKKVSLGIPKNARASNATDNIPLKRAGNVDDAAGGILMLASPFASYVSGHCLEVTGGV